MNSLENRLNPKTDFYLIKLNPRTTNGPADKAFPCIPMKVHFTSKLLLSFTTTFGEVISVTVNSI